MIRLVIETGTRLCGLLLLLTGMAAALFTVQEAWNLYESPERVNRFARQVETDTGLDRQVSQVMFGLTDKQSDAGEPAAIDGNAAAAQDRPDIRLTYFISWILIILVLSLLVRVSLAMAHTGSKILLHDLRKERKNGYDDD